MRKRLNKVMTTAMAMAMAASMCVPAFAATSTNKVTSVETVTNYEESESTTVEQAYAGDTKNTEVEVVRAATFKVTIPKKIILNGTRGEANDADYSVTVIADIPGDETVNVAPAVSTFKMSEAGGVKADIDATVTQADTTWTVADDGLEALAGSGVVKAGNVSVANLSAGAWSGNFDFNISITAPDTP